MNYRHIYHAGNFADVVKHILLIGAIERLHHKDKPMAVIDAFAGCGLYETADERAALTGEFGSGAQAFSTAVPAHPLLRRYMALMNKAGFPGRYPGSPWIVASLLRTQDSAVFNELHPEDYQTLKRSLPQAKGRIAVHRRDAYEVIRAHIPPPEKRGLVLIDPPFEKKDEFHLLQSEMAVWFKKWPTGSYIIWYPVKAHLPVNALKDAARATGFKNVWVLEFLIHPRFQPETLNGCGLLCLNTPYQLPETADALMPELIRILGRGRYEADYLT